MHTADLTTLRQRIQLREPVDMRDVDRALEWAVVELHIAWTTIQSIRSTISTYDKTTDKPST